jgi:L-lysine exporter family protein LysE/ArgO
MPQPGLLLAAEGFALNLGLLLAVGAQASFVLRQGLARRHVAWVDAICCASDAVLIGLGTLGPGVRGRQGCPEPSTGTRRRRLHDRLRRPRATRGLAGRPGGEGPAAAAEERLAAAVLATLAVTLLNLHVYVDSLVLLGGAAARHPPPDRAWFAVGAVAASVMWFLALGYGAVLVAGPLSRPRVRAALDLLVCAIMWRSAAALIAEA